MKQKYPDRDEQIILYAKGWYEEADPIEDLKKIICKCQWVDHVRLEDLWSILVELLFRVSPRKLQQVTFSMFNGWGSFSSSSAFDLMKGNQPVSPSVKLMVEKILAALSVCERSEWEAANVNPDNKNIDPEILPLKKHEK
jgi:hypothetical protein